MERNLAGTTKRFALSSLKRRWWVIPLAVIATALAGYGAASLKKETYTASSWTIATADTGSRGPGRAFDASRLALSYASSLSEDDQLISYIAEAINRPRDEVDDRFSTLNQTDTAVIRLRYRDEDPEVATRAARAAAEGSVGSRPVATSVTPSTMQLVQLATEPERSTDVLALGLAVGAALGLGLGIILMLAWERADPRVDEPGDVTALTGIPATRLDDLTHSRAAALLERWVALSGKRSARVAIIPTPRTQPVADQVAGWLYGMHVDGPDLDRGGAATAAAPAKGRSANGSSDDLEAEADKRGGNGRQGAAGSGETSERAADSDEGSGNGQGDGSSSPERVEYFHRPEPAADDPSRDAADRGARWRSRWYRPATAPTPASGAPAGGQPVRDIGATEPSAPAERETAGSDAPVGSPLREPEGEPIGAQGRPAPDRVATSSMTAAEVSRDDRLTLVAGGSAASDAAPEVEALRSDLIVLLVEKAATTREVLDLVATLEQFGRRPSWVLTIGSRRKVGKSMDKAQASGVNLIGHKTSKTASRN